MSLAKVSRKLRKTYKKGRVALYGAEQTARDVVGTWRVKRDREGTTWSSNYLRGLQEADTNTMAENLGNWYKILETEVAPKLREVVKSVFSEASIKHATAKKLPAKVPPTLTVK